ncbi:MAG: epoxyqueuosine reductase [Desulfobacteraceae bacterium]|jgi:epoxyqueuosine reductase QueG
MQPLDNPGLWIEELIHNFVSQSPKNRLGPDLTRRAFDAPLVGFSSGGDAIFDEFVAHIGDFYLTPAAIYHKAFVGASIATGDELTVISWILPQTAETCAEQAEQTLRPARSWAQVRFHGEAFNDALRHHVVESLRVKGIDAVAPMQADFWSRSDQSPYAPCSNWSERHAAYASGLGTFGLCDGLITPLGKAMRTGSVVARLNITPTPRPYKDHHAYCLFFSHGTCGKCIKRCPINAIGKNGHDKKRCQRYTEVKMPEIMSEKYGIDVSVCGLCQVGIPCTHGIPDPGDGV